MKKVSINIFEGIIIILYFYMKCSYNVGRKVNVVEEEIIRIVFLLKSKYTVQYYYYIIVVFFILLINIQRV